MGAPYVLVNLDLESNGQPIFKNPTGKIYGGQLVMGGRKQDRIRLVAQPFQIDFFRPFVVRPGSNDELELVVWLHEIDVLPTNGVAFVTIRTLDVNHLNDRFGHAAEVDM